MSSVVTLLEEVACVIFQRFKNNEMKANIVKCLVILSKSKNLNFKIYEFQIKTVIWKNC